MKYIRKVNINIILFTLLCCGAFGQKKEQEDFFYPFIKYQHNELYIPKEGTLQHFFGRLDELYLEKDTTINIVHIGDSHIQADFFSDVVRKEFHKESSFENGGRGFLFPFTMAKTNNPPFYRNTYKGKWVGQRNSVSRDHSNWGVAGITAKTTDSLASFTIILNPNPKDIQYDANRVRVYYPVTDSTSFDVFLKIGQDSVFADSIDIEGGYVQFSLDKTYSTFHFHLHKKDTLQNHFLVQGLKFDNNHKGIVYSSIGVNGAKVDSYLRCPLFTQHLKTLTPDLVIVSLGTNDAYNYSFYPSHFKSVYTQLIKNIKKASPHCSIILTTPGDGLRRRWQVNTNNQKAVKAVFELAKEHNCAVWDFYKVMGGLKSVYPWVQYGLGKRDYLHLTANGYSLQGLLFYRALIHDAYFEKHQIQINK